MIGQGDFGAMSGMGVGMRSVIVLTMYGAAVVLVIITGVTDMNIGYSEALLVFGGASIALLGGTILPERPAMDRRTGLFMIVMGMVAVIWVCWIRDHFDLAIQSAWRNKYYKQFQPLPQLEVSWQKAIWIIVGAAAGMATLMHGIRAAWRRFALPSFTHRKPGIRWLIVLAAFLYVCYLIQSRIMRAGGDYASILNVQSEPYVLLALVLIGSVIVPAVFFLPQRTLVAWLGLIAISALALGLEVTMRHDFDRIQGIATICLLSGFVLTAACLRPRRESADENTSEKNTSFTKLLVPILPGALLILAGCTTVYCIDIGQWAKSGNLLLASKVAWFRRLDTQIEIDQSWSKVITLKIGSKAPSNILELALEDVPSGTVSTIFVYGMRPDIDIAPVETGMPRGGGGSRGFVADGLRIESGTISEAQVCRILETRDLSLGEKTEIVGGDEVVASQVDRNSLQLLGTADSIIEKLKHLDQCNSLYSLILIVTGNDGWGQHSTTGHLLLEDILNNVKGKRLNFMANCDFQVDEIVVREELPQWESINLNLMQQNWNTGLNLAIQNQADAFLVVFRNPSDPLYVNTPEYAAIIRGAIATNGKIDFTLDLKELAKNPDRNFGDCFERFDCVLESDEQGNPVSVLALFPEFLNVLDDKQALTMKSILLGSEWGNLVDNSSGDFESIPTSLLERFSELTRLYLGPGRIDDHSFLKSMPELRELQVVEETAAERIADLAANLNFVPKLERFLITGMPEKSLARQLGAMPALKEVVLIGLEIKGDDGSALEPLRRLIPGVTIRVQPDFNLSKERPADLIEHQKAMLKRLAEELARPENSGVGK